MIINHNLSAMFADRNLQVTQNNLADSMQKLSSGEKINKAADDASGLAVSEKMKAQIRGLNQASQNAQNGISFIQTTEGYLQESEDIMQRLRELSVQSANGIYTNEDRGYMQVEVSQLVNEVNRIASTAQFNGMNMLTGRFAALSGANAGGKAMFFQVGANMDQRMQVYIGTMTAKSLGVDQLSLATADGANQAIGTIDTALQKINSQRANLGAYQNRLNYAVKGIDVAAENMTASESRIRDTDMASEMVNYTKNAILRQAGTAMLAQANQQGQTVLSLLQ
jgi:flagellin